MKTNAIPCVESFVRMLNGYPHKYKYIFLVMTETGMRISDVLNLKLRDIQRGKTVTEKKTRKKRHLEISADLKAELLAYGKTVNLRAEDFLFPSTRNNLCRPVSRFQVHRVFKAVARDLSLKGVISPHSCRKTYARQKMALHGDIKALQEDFGHYSKKTTEGYLE